MLQPLKASATVVELAEELAARGAAVEMLAKQIDDKDKVLDATKAALETANARIKELEEKYEPKPEEPAADEAGDAGAEPAAAA